MKPIENQLRDDLQRMMMRVCTEAALHFGLPNQILKLGEEAAELTRAVCMTVRDEDRARGFNNLKEEIVDVVIVTQQVVSMIMPQSEFEEILTHKLEKLESIVKTDKERIRAKGQPKL